MVTALARIEALLGETPHTRLAHLPTHTSQEAAAIRGVPLAIGGKSLVMKVGQSFAVFAVSGARQLHGRKIQRHLKVSRLRFARPEELLALTSLEPGCVPPFGHPIFDLPLYVDASIAANARIAFTPGDHGASIIMAVSDYLQLAAPTDIFDFGRDPSS
ncbi:MAG: Ala-tRNA(Pro) deacylase [Bradymonadia bacterium]